MTLPLRLSASSIMKGRAVFFTSATVPLAFNSGGDLNDFVASRPENGSFSCETFFYTQDNWKENLRFTRFENFDTVFLMSDGLTNFAFSGDFQNLEKGFIWPIHEFLAAQKTQTRASRALAQYFGQCAGPKTEFR